MLRIACRAARYERRLYWSSQQIARGAQLMRMPSPTLFNRQRTQSLAASFSTDPYEVESSWNWGYEEEDEPSYSSASSITEDDDDDDDDDDELGKLTVKQLKEILRIKGLKVSGRKDELLTRLKEAYSVNGSDVYDDSSVPESSFDENYFYTVRQLKMMLRMRGLKESGRKEELRNRLKEYERDEFKEGETSLDSSVQEAIDTHAGNDEAEEEEVPQEPEDICFDTADNYRMVKKSALERENRMEDALVVSQVLEESTTHESETLLELLPPEFQIDKELKRDLMEVVLDVGRRPFAWVNGERHFLSDGLVSEDHLKEIIEPLHFGSDNRAGINGSLHRISAVRNREDDIVGLTLRVGRFIAGNSIMIADILAGMPNASILICGEPGSGKTSIIRDAARFLAETNSLVIVDTSCEIGGSGNVPHHCIGLSRRMQVKTIDAQAKVMVEAVQNHTPAVMVIDEIGREAEVQAALTCKERGVRIIASAHGNLPGLVRNQGLCDLVGGVEAVTVGDKTAKNEAKRRGNKLASKLQAQRRGPPVFDIIIEVKRGQLHEWHVVMDCASAVDNILRDGQYTVQIRSREDSGASSIRLRQVSKDAHNLHKLIEEASKSTSMLNSIPVTEDENKYEYDYESVLKAQCCTCPVCDRELKNRSGLLNHLAMRPDCVAVLPDEIAYELQREVENRKLSFSLNW